MAIKKILKNNNPIILETCGLNYRLANLFNNKKLKKRSIYTIAFYGNRLVYYKRLKKRQIRSIPCPINNLLNYTNKDEYEAIDYVLLNIKKSITKIDYWINTSIKNPNEIYLELKKEIIQKRLEFNSQQDRLVRERIQNPTLFDELSLR